MLRHPLDLLSTIGAGLVGATVAVLVSGAHVAFVLPAGLAVGAIALAVGRGRR